jgi:hypothetical protein
MGEVISSNAAAERIEDHIRTSFDNGTARGGDIAAAAETRLKATVAAIDGAVTLRDAADKTESAAWTLVLVEDAKSDAGIGSVRDAMYNALGRSNQSAELGKVFPGGIGTYTAGDPSGQPLLMQVLCSRILAGSAPQWPEAMRQGWAAEIEALRVPYHAAVEAHRPSEATAVVALAGYRAAVRAGHARLVSYKRDLKNLGLTEAQIHEIIPDAGAGKSSKKGGGKGGGGEGGEPK